MTKEKLIEELKKRVAKRYENRELSDYEKACVKADLLLEYIVDEKITEAFENMYKYE